MVLLIRIIAVSYTHLRPGSPYHDTNLFAYTDNVLRFALLGWVGAEMARDVYKRQGFWLFGKFTGATEAETLKTWTMMETILGTVGAIVGMIAFQLLS